jgi:predicted esterase
MRTPFIIIFMFQVLLLSAQDLSKYKKYSQIDSLINKLCSEDKIEKAITVLEYSKSRFPGDLEKIISKLSFLYIKSNQFEKAIDNYESGQSKGLYFAFYPGDETYEPLLKYSRFRKFIEINNLRIKEEQKKVKPKYEVQLPPNYQKSNKHPLFIALHGWGEDVTFFMKYWKPGKSGSQFIFAYIQSSQLVGMNSYGWNNIETGRKEITEFFNWLRKSYKIDEENVIIGGFSQGGKMAIDIAMNQVIPVRGFVTLCPGVSEKDKIEIKKIKEANEKKVSGVIITGDQDESLKDQKKLTELLNENGFRYELIIIPGQSHWFPSDFPYRLDKAIEFFKIL